MHTDTHSVCDHEVQQQERCIAYYTFSQQYVGIHMTLIGYICILHEAFVRYGSKWNPKTRPLSLSLLHSHRCLQV